MEFALSDKNDRIIATRGVKGFCPLCGELLIPKCGEIKIHHWAHESKRHCDSWWEPESKWHRHWKDFVDEKFREVVIFEDEIKHIADVKLKSGIVFEFQKSPLSVNKRLEREKFYGKMIWVIHFPKDRIIENNRGMFGDSYIKVNSFSEGFFRPPHSCPIFLDFDDGEMFWIREFDEYDIMRAKWFYGRFIEKTEFVSRYLLFPYFSDIEELKVTCYHREYKTKQRELRDAEAELGSLKEELRVAIREKRINEDQRRKNGEAQRKYDEYIRKRQEIIKSINLIKNADSWGISTECNQELITLEKELKNYPIKEKWDDYFWI